MKYQSEIYIVNNDEQVNAKSILGLLACAFPSGSTLTLKAEGPDEKEAVNTLCGLVESSGIA
jgi:phosphotransferase system HPr (HPr) family protein